MTTVIRFEIHATDPQRLIDFYSELFGWTFTKWEDVDFWQIETDPESDAALPGGLVPRRGAPPGAESPVNAFVCTVRVDSIDAAMAAAASLGGQQAVPKMRIPNAGWLGYIKDPDGNLLGLSQVENS